MPRAYFVGGAPRVGKSTLAARILTEHPLAAAFTDDLRAELRHATPPAAAPDLYYLDSLNTDEAEMARLMRENTADIITAADCESAVVWPAVEAFVRDQLAAGHDVLIEGVAVLPQFLVDLNFDYLAVFLGNQSPAHAQIIHDYAHTHPHSWLGTLQPATIDAFAHFSAAASASIEREARKYYLPYVEMSAQPFPDGLTRALAVLQA
ncbi:MAG TPA: hypothetical protein VMT30_00470 [Candidatus Saccharimonadia bacterium]|nr:hypothetical protein [Candidatus Saccharimonadia bacterium]